MEQVGVDMVHLDNESFISIAQLNPQLKTLGSRSIRAVITLMWPYSSATGSISFLLSENDFRLRDKKGQIRVQFTGSSAKSLASSGIASGDSVTLSLEGVEYVRAEPMVLVAGAQQGFELRYSERLLLQYQQVGSSEVNQIDIDHPQTEESSASSFGFSVLEPEPSLALSPKTNDDVASIENIYSSPAFIKRARTSYGSLFDSQFDPFAEEEGSVKGRGRKRTRLNASWGYRSRSPTPSNDDQVVISPQITKENPTRSTPLMMTDEGVQAIEVELESKATSEIDTNSSSQEILASEAQDIPTIQKEATPSDDQETHLTGNLVALPPESPRLTPVSSDNLPQVSPLLSTGCLPPTRRVKPEDLKLPAKSLNSPISELFLNNNDTRVVDEVDSISHQNNLCGESLLISTSDLVPEHDKPVFHLQRPKADAYNGETCDSFIQMPPIDLPSSFTSSTTIIEQPSNGNFNTLNTETTGEFSDKNTLDLSPKEIQNYELPTFESKVAFQSISGQPSTSPSDSKSQYSGCMLGSPSCSALHLSSQHVNSLSQISHSSPEATESCAEIVQQIQHDDHSSISQASDNSHYYRTSRRSDENYSGKDQEIFEVESSEDVGSDDGNHDYGDPGSKQGSDYHQNDQGSGNEDNYSSNPQFYDEEDEELEGETDEDENDDDDDEYGEAEDEVEETQPLASKTPSIIDLISSSEESEDDLQQSDISNLRRSSFDSKQQNEELESENEEIGETALALGEQEELSLKIIDIKQNKITEEQEYSSSESRNLEDDEDVDQVYQGSGTEKQPTQGYSGDKISLSKKGSEDNEVSYQNGIHTQLENQASFEKERSEPENYLAESEVQVSSSMSNEKTEIRLTATDIFTRNPNLKLGICPEVSSAQSKSQITGSSKETSENDLEDLHIETKNNESQSEVPSDPSLTVELLHLSKSHFETRGSSEQDHMEVQASNNDQELKELDDKDEIKSNVLLHKTGTEPEDEQVKSIVENKEKVTYKVDSPTALFQKVEGTPLLTKSEESDSDAPVQEISLEKKSVVDTEAIQNEIPERSVSNIPLQEPSLEKHSVDPSDTIHGILPMETLEKNSVGHTENQQIPVDNSNTLESTDVQAAKNDRTTPPLHADLIETTKISTTNRIGLSPESREKLHETGSDQQDPKSCSLENLDRSFPSSPTEIASKAKHGLTDHDTNIESSTPLSQPLSDIQTSVVDEKLRFTRTLRTELSGFTSLKLLRFHQNQKLDILAVVTFLISPSQRAKNGPKDFHTSFNITDPTISPSGVVQVDIFRPLLKHLPKIEVGNGILLRNFRAVVENKVISLKSKNVEGSSWAVFRDLEKPEIEGPLVKYGKAETDYVSQLRSWFSGLGDEVKAKIARANENKMVTKKKT